MSSTTTAGRLQFKETCLFCDKNPGAPLYNCDCGDEDWKSQYRSCDLLLCYDSQSAEVIRESFHQYDLQHEDGMLQYKALPGRECRPVKVLPVGLTPLFHLQRVSKKFEADIYIKSEGHNPSGCFKDRETVMCLLNAKKQGLNKAVVYSSGNAAASAAIFAQKNGMHLITVVAGDTYQEKIDFIRAHGSDVIVIGDDKTNFETGYRLFARINSEAYFSNSNYDNWSVGNPHRVQGDKTTAVEIVKQLNASGRNVPDFVIVPTANGSCLAGIWKGFKELHELDLIDRLPKMVSAGIKNANPVYKAVQQRETLKPVSCDLSLLDPGDADIGSIILAEEGYDSMEAAKAVLESEGIAVEVTKADIEDTYHQLLQEETELAEDENLMPEPASVISIAAVGKLKEEQQINQSHTVVSVITGSGFKARNKIREIMADDPESLEMVEDILDRKLEGLYPVANNKGDQVNVDPNIEAVKEAFEKLKR